MDKKITLTQKNLLTEARQEFTALEKNLIFFTMAQMSNEDSDNKIYYVSATELQNKMGKQIRYQDFLKATGRLLSNPIWIKKPEGGHFQANFIASADYIKGTGIIELEVSTKMRKLLLNVKDNFTTFELDLALTLKSKFSKRIYEMLSQWKDKNQFSTTIEELKYQLGCKDHETGVESYEKWSNFEKYVLKKAEEEINLHTDFKMFYELKKVGRKYHSITFYFEKQDYQTTIDFQDEDAVLFTRLMNDLKLRKDQAAKIINRHTAKEVHKLIYDAKQEIRNREGSGKAIQSIGAWCAKRFDV
jgi:plasmid replication initiation protein